ncbi:MAG TPA: hypothetical protein VM389_04075, partial [Phycisphaerae bacterium]|nr:hypothetical protein [Phycisphaerae bacterium]
VSVLNNAAWLRATAADGLLRDGARAVKQAQRAVELAGESPSRLDTLAAAYAEAGRLADAVRTAERAKALARGSERAQLADRIEQRLALYRAGQPYHRSPGPGTGGNSE